MLAAGMAAGIIFAPGAVPLILLALLAVPFLMVAALRAAALWDFLGSRPEGPGGAQEKRGAFRLPTYSVLVPLFREADVVPHLLRALRAIDYPREKLDIVLIVESIDRETQAALRLAELSPHMRVLVVPDGKPRTKPRALQYALQFTDGENVVVYDAEDVPEPDQLRRAAAALAAGAGKLGCLQARLNIYNTEASWLTRQFTIEYTALFDCILPTLERLGLPVPLGGTSNHFPRAVLDQVGGWDPFNVTEDADLGIRLARNGWSVGVLASTTWEEAPVTARVWIGQRTRWLKGWMQTYIVHMRQPRRLLRELGLRRFAGFQVLMGGLILSALVHPWFYVFLAADALQGHLLLVPQSALGEALLAVGLVNLLAGYVSAIALGVLAAERRGRQGLGRHAMLMPLYWLGISWGAYRALAELIRAPYYWEKTEHRVRLSGMETAGTGFAGLQQERVAPMPARSKVQQEAAGVALAAKRGEFAVSKLKGASKSMYESMSEQQLEEFAATKRKGLPRKKAAARH
jgi:cellulose synthase/poly-beta-1,6-N-acetylglucosamine synthase-like glycosyltransferase